MSQNNLLILMTDQHSRKYLSCYGNPIVKTPSLDTLATDGSIFTSASTNSPICVPSRASLATGRYVHEIGCWDNAIAYDGKIPSWGHILQDANIDVTSIGKLHYRFESDPTGFDEQIVPMHIADGVGDLMGSIRPDLPERTQSKKYSEQVGPGETVYTKYDRKIAKRACDWISEKNKDDQWVLFVSFIAPHFPLIVPQEFFDLYPIDNIGPIKASAPLMKKHPWWRAFNECYTFDRYFKDENHRKIAIASYMGLCTFVDGLMGSIIGSLKDNNIFDNTNVIYLSDHGENLGARGLWGKSVMYEESVGVPIIMSGPDIPSGIKNETPVSLVDLFPTILDLSGLGKDKLTENLRGRSLLEILGEPFNPKRVVLSEYHGAAAKSGSFMLRDGQFKYIHYVGFEPELYDLKNDPDELDDISKLDSSKNIIEKFEGLLRDMLDPEKVNEKAFEDQAELIDSHGGVDVVLKRGGLHGTPVTA